MEAARMLNQSVVREANTVAAGEVVNDLACLWFLSGTLATVTDSHGHGAQPVSERRQSGANETLEVRWGNNHTGIRVVRRSDNGCALWRRMVRWTVLFGNGVFTELVVGMQRAVIQWPTRLVFYDIHGHVMMIVVCIIFLARHLMHHHGHSMTNRVFEITPP